MNSGKQLWSSIKNNQDLLIVDVVLLVKIVFFGLVVGLGFGPTGTVVSSAAALLVLSCWFVLFPRLVRVSLLLLFDFAVSIILLADLLFYRYFQSAISIPVLFEAKLVGGVSGSVFALLSAWDLLLFLDFVFLVPYFLRLRSCLNQVFRLRKQVGQVAAILLVSLFFLGYSTKSMAADFNKNAYVGLNWDNTVLENMGILNFHIFDLYNYIKEKNAKVSLDSERQVLRSWMDSHRTQGTSNYQAAAGGKNLIIVQLEAMQGFVIGKSVNGQEITPNLNKLLNSSMYFDNYFTQIGEGNTSDAEFMALNSLYPAAAGSNYIMKSKNTFQSLPWVLKGAGYSGAYVFHGAKPEFWNRTGVYPSEGFNRFYSLPDFNLDEKIGMGLSDESMFRQAVPVMAQIKQPFFSFIITLSAHYPYALPGDKQELNIPKGQYSEIFTNYLQAQHYADKALGEFVDSLQQQGILDNSLLVAYGDHYGSGWTNKDIESFLGMTQPLNDYTSKELNKVPLLIRLPGGRGAGVNHISGGQMDLFPTVINLLGVDKQNLFYFGRDLLNSIDGLTVFRGATPQGSFATKGVFYLASKDGVFEHGTAYSRETGEKIDLQGVASLYQKAKWQLQMSDLILDTNGLPQLVGKIH